LEFLSFSRALTKEEINKIPMISFTKHIKKIQKNKNPSNHKHFSKKSKLEEPVSECDSEKNEPTAYTFYFYLYSLKQIKKILNFF